MKLTDINELVSNWQVVRIMAPNGEPRYFMRSDTGQWGEIIPSLGLQDEQINSDTVATIDGNVWITHEVENNFVEELAVVEEPPAFPFVISPMPEDTKDRESLDATNPAVYTHEEPEGPAEEATIE